MSPYNNNNPWLDIASYTINDAPRFKGREKAIVKFCNIANNGTMSVLYANSGIGKTSFLNAGVDPLMKKAGYFPIHILFPDDIFMSGEEVERWLIKIIESKIAQEDLSWNSQRNLIAESDKKNNDIRALDTSLWFNLHSRSLRDKQNNTLKILLVFDQFEEVFTKSRKLSNNSLPIKLFQIIEELSNNSLPPAIDIIQEHLVNEDIYLNINRDIYYKVIFSLRKEYLSDFDYWTQDRYSISELQQNRMLLLPLTRKQAIRVITEQPASDGNGNVQTLNDVQQDIINKLDSKNRNEVEPFLLSVLCSRLYAMAQSANKEIIRPEDLQIYDVDTIMRLFYEEKINEIIINSHHLTRFENLLVDEDGIRNRTKVKELRGIGFEKNYQEALLKAHLIRIDTFDSDEKYVELIHDRIADAIVAKRSSSNKEHKRRLKILAPVLLFMTIAILAISIPRTITVDGCTQKHKKESPIDTIERAYTAECDSILMLQNIYVSQSAFNTNPHVKTIHVKSNVTLSQTCFANCPNLTSIIFDGKNINLGDDVFYGCNSLHSIEITDSACFCSFGKQSNAPNLSNFIVAQNNRQCEVDKLGHVLRVDDAIWPRDDSELSACYLPKAWESLLLPKYRGDNTLKWCDTITFNQLECNDYNTNNKYYLIDTSSTIPVLDNAAKKFLKNNVLYACLPNISVVRAGLFEHSIIQRIDIHNVSHIQRWAFSLSKLHHIESPNIKIVDDYAFAFTRNLQKDIRWDSLEQIGNFVFRNVSMNSIEFPNLKVANENSFTSLEVDTLFLPFSLFYIQDTCSHGEGQSFKVIEGSPYGINPVDFTNSSSIGTSYIIVKKAANLVCYIPDDTDSMLDLQDRTSTLNIGKDVHQSLPRITGTNKLENINVDFRNSTYFSYRNILYRKDGISYERVLVAPNQPRVFIYNYSYGGMNVGEKTKEIIFLDAFHYTKLTSINEQKKNITVFFPYGSENYIRQLSKTDLLSDYKDVKEMSYLRTAYYDFTFRVVMNFHYNYWIFISLFVFFILLLIAPIRRLKLSNLKIIFSVVYAFLSLTGCFFIISSRLLMDKIPTIQFTLVFLWFVIASRIAEWVASPKYSWLPIVKDILSIILGVSLWMSAVILFHRDTLDIGNIWNWIIVFSILAVFSCIALIFINKQKVIYDKYATTHLYRRFWFALECYMYLAISLGVIFSIHLEDSKIMDVNAFAMLVAVTIVIGFIIAHWNIGRETGFAYSEYMALRNQLKSQQLMTFNSDSILIKRMRMGILFDGIAAILFFVLISECDGTENVVLFKIILGVLLLLPIIMHICFKYKTISYSDLIKQYQIEYQELLSAKQNLPPELKHLDI